MPRRSSSRRCGRRRRRARRSRAAIDPVHELLMFVNDVCAAIEKAPDRPDAFRYTEADAFPATEDAPRRGRRASASSPRTSIARRPKRGRGDRAAADRRRDRPRSRRPACGGRSAPATSASCSGRARATACSKPALRDARVPYYVYKGLGFFDADEVKDVLALVSYLADPASNLRAAALLRSRIVRHLRCRLKQLAPGLAAALTGGWPAAAAALAPTTRAAVRWRATRSARGSPLADQLPPAELIDRVLAESAYAVEIGARLRAGAREPEEDSRADPPHPEPRLRHAGAAVGLLRRPRRRRRRVERDHRRRRRGEPDDRARREGPRVPGRLRRQYRQGQRRHPRRRARVAPPFTGASCRPRRGGRAVGDGQRSRVRRAIETTRRSRGNQAAAVRGADAGARSPVSGGTSTGRQAAAAAWIDRPVAACCRQLYRR